MDNEQHERSEQWQRMTPEQRLRSAATSGNGAARGGGSVIMNDERIISRDDIDSAIRALQARLVETNERAFYCRPLQRRQVALMLTIIKDYQALTQRKEK